MLGSFFLACKTVKTAGSINPVEVSGVVQKSGMTAYQYGTHVLNANGKTYALKSASLNLDTYVDKNVKLKGTKVEGYPVETGPELLEVMEIK
jgi:hypothetical protein